MSATSPVLCDAGPLMVLGKLNRLDLLASLYREVWITRAVYNFELLLHEIAARPDIWIGAGLCEQVLTSLRSLRK